MLSSLSLLSSCNKDDKNDDNEYTYSTSQMTTLVTGFALQADAEVWTRFISRLTMTGD